MVEELVVVVEVVMVEVVMIEVGSIALLEILAGVILVEVRKEMRFEEPGEGRGVVGVVRVCRDDWEERDDEVVVGLLSTLL
jgi:hypothetical protein